MRTSVCEFLRQMTQMSWCSMRRNEWISDGWKFRAERDDTDWNTFHVFDKDNKCVGTYSYFEGASCMEVRAKVKAKRGGHA